MNFRKGGDTIRFLVTKTKGREWKNLGKSSGEMGRSRATQDSNLLAQVVRVSSYSQSLSFSPRDGARSLGVARVESIDPSRLTCRTRDHLPYLLLVLHQGPELSPLVPTT